MKAENSKIIIVLGSGKCGTTTVSHLLNLSPNIFAGHELNPRLWHLGNEVFYDDCQSKTWDQIYWATRRDIVSNINSLDLTYGEVNHRISVFLPAMKRLFPNARYILLWRDFDETVISACRWGWYSKFDRNAEGRVHPGQKIKDVRLACAWYWVELYSYLLRHLKNCKYTILPFDWIKNRNFDYIQSIFKFLKVGIPEKRLIKDVLMQKYNAARNQQKVPKIWQKYDNRAKNIQEILSASIIFS